MSDGLDGIDISQEMLSRCVKSARVGSRATCNPPPIGTDDDRLLLVTDLVGFVQTACANGWQTCGSLHNEIEWASLRRGDVNLIATDSGEWYRKFIAAASVAKRLNLLVKSDRIALFRAVLYAEAAS